MLPYIKNYYIEEWFKNSGVTEGNKSNQQPNDEFHYFMSKRILDFWDHLELMDVLMLAKASKLAPYQIYTFNIKNFATFCKTVWQTKSLDVRNFPQTSFSLKTLIEMFKPLHINLPPQIAYETLTISSKTYGLTFNLTEDTPSLIRPQYELEPLKVFFDLTINGYCSNKLSDPTNDILCSFKTINVLELKDIHIQPLIMASLGMITIKI